MNLTRRKIKGLPKDRKISGQEMKAVLGGTDKGFIDSNDRYSNTETSYLLQRIESYDGLAVLASNLTMAS